MDGVAHDGRRTAFRVVVEGDGDGGRRGTDAANGTTTVYVHGSGGSHQVWANQYARDGPTHPAAALDLSGHGESEDFDQASSDSDTPVLDAYASDVAAVADAVAADVLVGNSLGGAVVLHATLDDAVDPAAIVLAGTGARLPVDEKLRTLLAEDFDAAVDVLHGDDVLFHDADERTLTRSKATMRSVGRAVVRRDFMACHDFDVRERLHEIDVPALAVVGEHDRMTPPEYHRELAEEMPDCRYREIDGAAHLAMLDQPAAFNGALADFFEEVR